ncbi:MAG: O-antigen ligase family protein [Campylobacterales bacterium]
MKIDTLSQTPWCSKSAWWVGTVGLLVFAVGLSTGKALLGLGLLMMLAGIVLDYKNFLRALALSRPLQMIFLFVLYVWTRTACAILEGDVQPWELLEGARKYSGILIIVVVAWWFGGSEGRIKRFFILTAAAMVLNTLIVSGMGFETIGMGRGFELKIPTLMLTYSFFGALVCVWLFSYSGSLIGIGRQPQKYMLLRASVLIFSFSVVFLLIVSLEARASVASLLFALLFLGAALFVRFFLMSKTRSHRFYALTAAIVLSAAVIGLTIWNHKLIVDRFLQEKSTFEHLLSMEELENTPVSSTGHRVHLARLAVTLFIQKPLFGQGWGGIDEHIKGSDIIPQETRQFVHFHNGILEGLVAWGLVGAFFVLLFFVFLLRDMLNAFRSKQISLELAFFLCGGFIVFLASALTESFGMRTTQWAYSALLFGVMLSFSAGFTSRSVVSPSARST